MPIEIDPQHNLFYYSKEVQKEKFSRNSRGRLIIARHFKGLPAWKQTASEKTLVLKTLIFSNPFLFRDGTEKFYAQIFKAGYQEILVWADKKLVTCKSVADLIVAVPKITPSPHEEIIQAAVKLKLRPDQVINLDYLRFRITIHSLQSHLDLLTCEKNQVKKNRAPRSNGYLKLEKEIEYALGHMRQLQIEHIQLDDLLGLSPKRLEELLDTVRDRQVQGLFLSEKMDEKNEHANKILKMIVAEFKDIRYLGTEGRSYKIIHELKLEYPAIFSKLEYLISSGLRNHHKEEYLAFFCNMTGEKIEDSVGDEKTKDLSSLVKVLEHIKNADQVKRLEFIFNEKYKYQYEELKETSDLSASIEIDFDEASLYRDGHKVKLDIKRKNLKPFISKLRINGSLSSGGCRLGFSYPFSDSNDFKDLIRKNPSLVELVFDRLELEFDGIDSSFSPIQTLKALHFYNCRLNVFNVFKLICASPSLKEFVADQCYNISGFKEIEDLSKTNKFENLASSLTSVQVSDSQYIDFWAQEYAPLHKTLKVVPFFNINFIKLLLGCHKRISSLYLEEFEYSRRESNDFIDFHLPFLKHAKIHTKSRLDLRRSSELSNLTLSHELRFNKNSIKKLEFKDETSDMEGFFSLMNNQNQLNELNLSDFNADKKTVDFKRLNPTTIKCMSLNRATSLSLLVELINRCPQLVSLKFKDYYFLEEKNFKPELIELKKLKELFIGRVAADYSSFSGDKFRMENWYKDSLKFFHPIFPFLEQLECDSDFFEGLDIHSESKVIPALKSARLNFVKFGYKDALRFLYKASGLLSLSLSLVTGGEFESESLALEMKDILPRLQYLEVGSYLNMLGWIIPGAEYELISLTLSYPFAFSFEDISSLLSTFKKLKHFYLIGADIVLSRADLSKLRAAYPHVHIEVDYTRDDRVLLHQNTVSSTTKNKKAGYENPLQSFFNMSLDSQTNLTEQEKNAPLKVNYYFENVDPRNYICYNYSDLDDGFELSRSEYEFEELNFNPGCKLVDDAEVEFEKNYKGKENYFIGNAKFKLFDFEEVYLPALSLTDYAVAYSATQPIQFVHDPKMMQYYMASQEGFDQPTLVSIKYIVNTKGNHIKEDYTSNPVYLELINKVFSPKKKDEDVEMKSNDMPFRFEKNSAGELELIAAPFSILDLQKFFLLSFGCGELSNKNAKGLDLVNGMLKEKKGACRHRAILFKAIMSKVSSDLKIRICVNGCHMGVLILYKDQWFPIELGGYPVELEDDNIDKAIEKKLSAAFEPDSRSVAASFKKPLSSLLPIGEALKKGTQNILIRGCDEEFVLKINSFLRQKQGEKNRNYYFINDLSEISTVDIKVTEKNKFVKIDSDLVQFLKQAAENPNEPSVLVVDWSSFKPNLVGYNTMMDAVRRLNSQHLIPENVILFGLINEEEFFREDFFSRFAKKFEASDFNISSVDPYQSNYRGSEKINSDLLVVDLTGKEEDWRDEVIGQLCPDEKGLVHAKPGVIAQCGFHGKEEKRSLSPKGITFINPPDTQEFKLFVSDMLTEGKVKFNDSIYQLPKNFSVECVNRPVEFVGRYSIEKFSQDLSWAYPLNRSTRSYFFKLQQFEKNKVMEPAGWLSSAAKKVLTVSVTDNFSESEWSRFLSEAKKYDVQLRLIVGSSIFLPEEMEKKAIIREEKKEELIRNQHKIHVFNSNNFNAIVDDLCKEFKTNHVISIHPGLDYNDLIFQVKNSQTTDENPLSYDVIEGSVLKALRQGERVILKGNFSKDLSQHLETLFSEKPYLLVNGEKEFIKGELIIVTPDNNIFNEIRPLEGWKTIQPVGEIKSEELKVPPVTEYKNRLRDVKEVFKHSPCVFIQGGTGAGKSSWVYDVLGKEGKVYSEMSSLSEWAYDNSGDQLKVLFIDEANLEAEGSFECFEDMYNRWQGKGILIDGQYVKLTDKHKVVFAGNTKDYTDRISHQFFERRNAILTFENLPREVLLRNLIEPALGKEAKNIYDIFLKHYACERKQDALPVTPRNLKMMLGYFKLFSEYKKNLDISQKDLAKMAVYQELSFILSGKDKCILSKELFNNSEMPKRLQAILPSGSFESKKFICTPSRHPLVQSLKLVLDLRARNLNGDKNGFLIEGPSGIGKSSMVFELLNEMKISPVVLTAAQPDELAEKLNQAFHEGRVVVIDEINTLEVEKILNRLMMGFDMAGRRAAKPGFFVIGTQNPATSSCRKILSDAFLNRFSMASASHFSDSELKQIIQARGFSNQESDDLLKDEKEKCENIKGRTTRDFFRELDEMKEHEKPVPMETKPDSSKRKREEEGENPGPAEKRLRLFDPKEVQIRYEKEQQVPMDITGENIPDFKRMGLN